MITNEKAHLRGAGLLQNSTLVKRGNQSSVSSHSGYSASAVIEACTIRQIWDALGGGDLRQGRGRGFWRGGDGFNVALYLESGTWHDYATNEGGGKLGLIQKVLGCSRQDALKWLSELTGIPLASQQVYSPEQRRAYAKARQDAAEVAQLATWWFESKREQLEAQKRRSNGFDGPWNEVAFEAASSELWRLSRLDAVGILAAWGIARQADPGRARALEAAGKAWQARYDEAVSRILRPLGAMDARH